MNTKRKVSSEKPTKSPKKTTEKPSQEAKKPKKNSSNRVLPEELIAGLFITKPPKNKKIATKTTLYTFIDGKNGKNRDDFGNWVTEDEKAAFAKTVVDNNKMTHFILGDKKGFYDPAKDENKSSKHKVIERWSWVKVSTTVLNYYLSFLRTKNKTYLNHAEREMYG